MVLGRKILRHGGRHPSFLGNRQQQGGLVGGQRRVVVLEGHLLLVNQLVDGSVDIGVGDDLHAAGIDTIQDGLHIPGLAIDQTIKPIKHGRRQLPPLAAEEPAGKVVVDRRGNFLDGHHLGTLIEWSLGRQEHVGHHVLLATRKEEIGIGHKLYEGTQQGLGVGLGIPSNLLELIDGDVAPLARLPYILEDALQRLRLLRLPNIQRERGQPRDDIKRHRRAKGTKEILHLAERRLRGAVEPAQHAASHQLHELLQGLCGQDIEVDAADLGLPLSYL